MKETVMDMFNGYVDRLQPGEEFQPRDISGWIASYTRGRRQPYDGTIVRYIMKRRAVRNDVRLVSRPKSVYAKV